MRSSGGEQRKVEEESIQSVQVALAASKSPLRASRRLFHSRSGTDAVPPEPNFQHLSGIPRPKGERKKNRSGGGFLPESRRRRPPFFPFTGGTVRGKTRQVGRGKKERDGSNWIHRFLRNQPWRQGAAKLFSTSRETGNPRVCAGQGRESGLGTRQKKK